MAPVTLDKSPQAKPAIGRCAAGDLSRVMAPQTMPSMMPAIPARRDSLVRTEPDGVGDEGEGVGEGERRVGAAANAVPTTWKTLANSAVLGRATEAR